MSGHPDKWFKMQEKGKSDTCNVLFVYTIWWTGEDHPDKWFKMQDKM